MKQQVLAVLMALMPVTALAQPATPDTAAQAGMTGNLAAGFYPKPACVAPSSKRPIKPALSDPGAVVSYNARIQDINKQTAVYNDCMQAYGAKVNNDLQSLLSTVNGAVAEATGKPPPAPPATAGNLPLGFYPKSSCVKPDQTALGVIPSPQDRPAMAAYNLKVKTFNDEAAAFNGCLKTYQDKAKRDIDEIQAVSQAAIAAGKQEDSPNRQ